MPARRGKRVRRGRDLAEDVQRVVARRPRTAATARTPRGSSPSDRRRRERRRPPPPASTAPFHATSAPPSAQQRRGVLAAAPAAPPARGRSRGRSAEPSATPPRARGPRATFVQPGDLDRPLEVAAVPDRALDERTPRASGSAAASARPGPAGAGAEVGDPRAARDVRQLERDQRVGDVDGRRASRARSWTARRRRRDRRAPRSSRMRAERARRSSRRARDVRRDVSRETRPSSSSGATTRWRSGSVPSEYVSTSSRSLRYSWTTLRSVALIASSATGRPVRTRVSAAWSAWRWSACSRRSR